MSWRWRYLDSDGAHAAGPDVTFDNQDEAQRWLSGEWEALLASGVAAVSLLAGESVVYGPMSLQAE